MTPVMLRNCFVFLLLLFLHLLSITLEFEIAIVITKPLLLVFLIYYFTNYSKTYRNANRWVLPALIFSLLGDVLLLFQQQHPPFFLFGLGAFLIAHLFYIFYFVQLIRANGKLQLRLLPILLVMGYAIFLIGLLFSKLGNLLVPVIVYAFTITTMLIAAIHGFKKNTIAARFCITGAIFFILSDSVLAFNKFHTGFNGAALLIMFTYGLAQLFLVNGILKNQS